jgi:cardiolipin synthase A/B
VISALDVWCWLLAPLAAVSAGSCILVVGSRRRSPRVALRAIADIETDLHSIAGVTGGSISEGNAVEILQDGDGFFPALLKDIAAARHSIHLESYVWSRGEIVVGIAEALAARARDGVEVRLLIDALGANQRDPALIERMKRAGCRVAVYCPLGPQNLRRWNHRTHRKLFITDGRVGIVFGHGIGDLWTGAAEDGKHYRDTAIRVVGPVVHGLQSVFAENWTEETHELLIGREYFPSLEPAGPARAHVVSSSSGDAISSVALVYSIAIASARCRVIIQNPYFVPRWDVVELMAKRCRDGVAIHLMLPGLRTDHALIRHAGHHLVRGLLEAGVRVYEYDRTLLHQKIMVIDGKWSHVGSTNFDARSLELNEEVSIGVIDEKVAAQLEAAFVTDLKFARELMLDGWSQRTLRHRAIDAMAYRIRSHL